MTTKVNIAIEMGAIHVAPIGSQTHQHLAMKTHTKSKIIILGLLFASPGMLQAVPVAGFLGGLLSPTGAATNDNNDRQYAWTTAGTDDAAGAVVTVTYTLSTSGGNLSNAFGFDNLFRYAPGVNVPSGQDFTITIDQITINAGWTLNSVSMSDTVTVAINGGNTASFSVNGGATFDYVGTGTGVSQQVVTNSQFEGFNGAGDSIYFLNVSQTANGGMNLRNLNMTFDVTAAPISDDPPVLVISGSGDSLDFEWNSADGKQYDLLGSTTLDTSPDTWPVYDDGENVYENIPFSGTGTNSLSGVLPIGPRHFFVLREEPLDPPVSELQAE